MPNFSVSATARVGAPAAVTYGIIADYHNGHPHILPAKYFRNLTVEQGGVGAGTRIKFQMGVLGKWNDVVGDVTEPEPGRLLHEFYPATNILTAFLVEPDGPDACMVTFTSTMPTRAGLGGALERWFVTSYLRKVYRAELQQLDEFARRARR